MGDSWTIFADRKPPKAYEIYWWRVQSRDYHGLTLRPEWTDQLCEIKSGGKQVLLPSHAQAKRKDAILPSGLEWRPIEEGDKYPTVVWPGLGILDCPFCGIPPTFHSDRNDPAGGGRRHDAWPDEHNRFSISCDACGIAGTSQTHDIAALVGRWNTRRGGGEILPATQRNES